MRAQPFERTAQRSGYAKGYKPKTLRTPLGEVHVVVPQVRDGDFYPSALEKGTRTKRALKAALAEIYIQGITTRRVATIAEQLCGFEVSSPSVSRCTVELDNLINQWREQPLGADRH